MASSVRYVFATSVECLLRGLGTRATPELRARLRERGLDIARLPAAISVEEWTPQLIFISEQVFPGVPRGEALYSLGRHFMLGWKQSLMGSAISSLLRVVGPVRSLPRLERAFRTSNNFVKARTELLDAHSARIHLNDVYTLPEYWAGVIHGGLTIIGREGEVTVEKFEHPGCTLFVRWR